MRENREHVRLPLRLETQWNGSARKYPAVTSDISSGGCYVESMDPVTVGDVLRLEFRLQSNRTLPLKAEVRYCHPFIGFGLRFVELSSSQQGILSSLMRQANVGQGLLSMAPLQEAA
jgi:hypothetical protein